MSYSTFNTHVLTFNRQFGLVFVDRVNTLNTKLSVVSKDLTLYRDNGYCDFKDSTFQDATFENKPIVAMLYSKPVNTEYVVIVTRNE